MSARRRGGKHFGPLMLQVFGILITFVKMIGLFLDVATYMMRLLVNTLVYDTPHGKQEVSGKAGSGS